MVWARFSSTWFLLNVLLKSDFHTRPKWNNEISRFSSVYRAWILGLVVRILGLLMQLDNIMFILFSRWLFQICFIFTPIWGRFPFWRAYFSTGLVQPPTSFELKISKLQVGSITVHPDFFLQSFGDLPSWELTSPISRISPSKVAGKNECPFP